MGLNWLVTGGCGFIGSRLVKKLCASAQGHRIRVVDNLSTFDIVVVVVAFAPAVTPLNVPFAPNDAVQLWVIVFLSVFETLLAFIIIEIFDTRVLLATK